MFHELHYLLFLIDEYPLFFIVRLTTTLIFMEDDEALTKPGIIRTIYKPKAGNGRFLSSGMEYVPRIKNQRSNSYFLSLMLAFND